MKFNKLKDFDYCLQNFHARMKLIEESINLIISYDVPGQTKQYMLKPFIDDYRNAVQHFKDQCTYNKMNYCETDYHLGLEYWEPMPEYDEFVNLYELCKTDLSNVKIELD